MSFWNVKHGPVVIEMPPAEGGSFAGNIVNAWQMSLEDACPEGADGGPGRQAPDPFARLRRRRAARLLWIAPASLRSTSGVQANEDGSVDVFFGPAAPAGREARWVPTDPTRKFELLFRLYGPEKPLFDKRWRLPDAERMTTRP